MNKPQQKHWSLMAYIAGDNDLSTYALSDIEEMCRVGASRDCHVSVQIDTEGDHDGLIRYEITEADYTGRGYRKVIERLHETDSGSPVCLSGYLKFGLKRYPSREKVAVVWSHGSGFKQIRRDIGFDYDTDHSMDMNEIISALSGGGINKNNKLSILGFDACLMAMLEVAHHMNEHAEILVGSQQTEPGNGWPYNQVLSLLNKNKNKVQVAKGIVTAYIDSYRRSHESGVTQSAIDLSKTDAAINALSEFGEFLLMNLDGIKTTVNKSRIAAQNFEYHDYIDIIDFARLLNKRETNNKDLKKVCNNLIKAVENAVIYSKYYGRGVERSTGLSLWFPCSRDQYILNRSKYLKLKCNEKKFGWLSFLDEFYS